MVCRTSALAVRAAEPVHCADFLVQETAIQTQLKNVGWEWPLDDMCVLK